MDKTIGALIFWAFFYVSNIFIFSFFIRLFRRRSMRSSSYGTDQDSLLLAFYSKGLNLQPMARGEVEDMNYVLFLTLINSEQDLIYSSEPWAVAGTIIYQLELPFYTEAHIVGVSKRTDKDSTLVQEYLRASGLERIELEGDFVNYLDIYSEESQGTNVRYVLDPSAMQYALDNCKFLFWEIVGDELYFTIEPGQAGDDIINNSAQFVNQIKPALIKKYKGKSHRSSYESPYLQYRGDPLKCPICDKHMKQTEYWFDCPNSHGKLLVGGNLNRVRDGEIKITEDQTQKAISTDSLVLCPHCGSRMHKVNYQSASIIIDSCISCPYRWLDSGELTKIMPKLPEQRN